MAPLRNPPQAAAQPPSLSPRSRSGCKTCRRRHRKCDERKPTCTPCESRGLECDYQVILKWASVGSVDTFDPHRRQRNTSTRRTQAGQRRRESAPTGTTPRRDVLTSSPRSRVHAVSDRGSVQEYQTDPRGDLLDAGLPGFSAFPVDERQINPCYPQPCEDKPPFLSTPISVAQPFRWGDAVQADPESDSSQGQGGRNSGNDNGLQLHEHVVDDDDETSYLCYDQRAQYQDGPAPPESSQWVIDSTFTSLLVEVLPDPAEEIAFTYYMKRVSVSTPAYDSDKNPYRKLALLSLSHPVLLHGILSVSTGHMHNYGRSNEGLLSSRQSRALTSLQAALNTFQMTSEGSGHAATDSDLLSRSTGIFSVLSPREVALAAIMMQTSSVLMTGIGSVEVHMKCALHFIRDLGYMGRPASSVFTRLLVQRFAMVDVVLAHLRFRRTLAPLDFFMYQNNEQLDHTEPAFREMQGCPQRVLCFLAHISVLSADLVQGSSPPPQVQAEAYSLETKMRVWGHKYHDAMNRAGHDGAPPRPPPGSRENSTASQIAYLDDVCECFYWTAHLLLMRRVFVDPTSAARVQLVRRHLFRLMDALPVGCGPDSSLPFPFYMAAREAVAREDREWVRRKHGAWMDTYRDRSREYMMASVEKIWEKGATTYQAASNSAAPWDTPYEIFIREMDHQASYFMF